MLLNVAMSQKKQDIQGAIGAAQSGDDNALSFEDMLIAVGKKKDKECFIDLFNHFAPRIKSFLMKGGLTPEIADELAQETMLAIWNKAHSFDPRQAAASTWIFTIARNKRIDHLRKVANYRTQSDEDMVFEDPSATPVENTSQKQETQRIKEALKTLPEEQLSLIKKSFFEDKSHAIIAKETGIPLGTVKSRIRLALDRLRGETGVKELWN